MIFKWKRRFWMYRMTRVGALNVRGVHCVHMLRDKVCHGSDGAFRFLAHWKSQVQWWFFSFADISKIQNLPETVFACLAAIICCFFRRPHLPSTFPLSPALRLWHDVFIAQRLCWFIFCRHTQHTSLRLRWCFLLCHEAHVICEARGFSQSVRATAYQPHFPDTYFTAHLHFASDLPTPNFHYNSCARARARWIVVFAAVI